MLTCMRDIHVPFFLVYLSMRLTTARMAEQSKESGGAYVHLISGSHSVTVNNGSGMTLGGSSVLPTVAGRVIVTPLTSNQVQLLSTHQYVLS